MRLLLAFIFGLIVLAIECYAVVYLFTHDYFWTSVLLTVFGAFNTSTVIWGYLTDQRTCTCEEAEEE